MKEDSSSKQEQHTKKWEEALLYLANNKPISLKSFTRMFKSDKRLVAQITKGREEPPFVILADGRVTVDTQPEGAEELQRREILGQVQYSIKEKMKVRSFFTLDDFSDQEIKLARREALQAGCIDLKMGSRELFCSPIKASSNAMANELKEYTGLILPSKGSLMTPVGYLLDNSYTARETGRLLGVRPSDLESLLELGYLQGFNMEGLWRYWQMSVETVGCSPHMERILRRTERIKTGDAARILAITRDQVKQLIQDGHLHSTGHSNRGQDFLCRGDVEDLLASLPEIRHRWEEQSSKVFEKTARRKLKRPVGRRIVLQVDDKPLTLDAYQQKSIAALLEGHSVLVAAPTGTGKTLIAERLAEHILAKGQEVVYTSPIKALSNQKYRDFVHQYGYERVGLITGDFSINDRAQLLVMTTEIFRNWCFSNPDWLDNVSHVIFDEVHYLDDVERGTAWEESIIFAPPHIRILGLSATVPNIYEIARWIEHVRGSKVQVVVEDSRAVPLIINWLTPDYEVLDEDEARAEIRRLYRMNGHYQYMYWDEVESEY